MKAYASFDEFNKQILNSIEDIEKLEKNGFKKFEPVLYPLLPRFVYNNALFNNDKLVKKYTTSKFSSTTLAYDYKQQDIIKKVSIRWHEIKNNQAILNPELTFKEESINYVNAFENLCIHYSKENQFNTDKTKSFKAYIEEKKRFAALINDAFKSYLEVFAIGRFGNIDKYQIIENGNTIEYNNYTLCRKFNEEELYFADLFDHRLEENDHYDALHTVDVCKIIFDDKLAFKYILKNIDEYLEYEKKLIDNLNYIFICNLYKHNQPIEKETGKPLLDFVSYEEETIDGPNVERKVTTLRIPFLGVSLIESSLTESGKVYLLERVKEFVEEYNSFEVPDLPSFEEQANEYINMINKEYLDICECFPGGSSDLVFLKDYKKALNKFNDIHEVIDCILEIKNKNKKTKVDSLSLLLKETVDKVKEQVSLNENKRPDHKPIVLDEVKE